MRVLHARHTLKVALLAALLLPLTVCEPVPAAAARAECDTCPCPKAIQVTGAVRRRVRGSEAVHRTGLETRRSPVRIRPLVSAGATPRPQTAVDARNPAASVPITAGAAGPSLNPMAGGSLILANGGRGSEVRHHGCSWGKVIGGALLGVAVGALLHDRDEVYVTIAGPALVCPPPIYPPRHDPPSCPDPGRRPRCPR